MAENIPIKVLIVDDHALIRKGITSLLENVDGIQVVGESATGEDALEKVQTCHPDVVLMDIQMPGMGGLAASRQMIIMNPDIKILALTVYDSDIYPLRFFHEGASGYITKNSSLEDLTAAIRTVVSGKRYISPVVAQKLALRRCDSQKSPFECLSKRELQIAMMIIQGQKCRDIATILNLNMKTVNTYRYRIFEKTGVDSDVELTLLAQEWHFV